MEIPAIFSRSRAISAPADTGGLERLFEKMTPLETVESICFGELNTDERFARNLEIAETGDVGLNLWGVLCDIFTLNPGSRTRRTADRSASALAILNELSVKACVSGYKGNCWEYAEKSFQDELKRRYLHIRQS